MEGGQNGLSVGGCEHAGIGGYGVDQFSDAGDVGEFFDASFRH